MIVYVKDKGTNINMLVFALTSVVCCELLQLLSPLNDTCLGHVMSKACQHAINDTKLGVGMKEVSGRSSKCIVKNHYGRRSWAKAGKNGNLHVRKLA